LREKLDSLQQLGENFKALQAQIANTPQPGSTPLVDKPAARPPHQPGVSSTPVSEAGMAGPSSTSGANDSEPLREKLRSLVDDPNIQSMNVHEWLIGRLTALEAEQRTRWQKILDMVRGK